MVGGSTMRQYGSCNSHRGWPVSITVWYKWNFWWRSVRQRFPRVLPSPFVAVITPTVRCQFKSFTIGKATHITGLWGLESSGQLRLQITRHSAHEGGKVVTCRLYPQEYPGTHFQRLSRPHGTQKCQLPQNKFQASPLGIDPGPHRLVATLPQAPLYHRRYLISAPDSVVK